jgi:hypothetical protein
MLCVTVPHLCCSCCSPFCCCCCCCCADRPTPAQGAHPVAQDVADLQQQQQQEACQQEQQHGNQLLWCARGAWLPIGDPGAGLHVTAAQYTYAGEADAALFCIAGCRWPCQHCRHVSSAFTNTPQGHCTPCQAPAAAAAVDSVGSCYTTPERTLHLSGFQQQR